MTLAGLAIWVLAAGVAIAGQSLAVSAHPEDARPWLIAAAVLGYIGVRILERDTPEPSPRGADVSVEATAIRPRRRVGGLAIMALGGPMAMRR